MIYTLTLNPAIDLFIKTQEMQPNTVNRTESYDVQANGKGVNVSFVLHRLGIVNTALGVGAGFTLDYITNFLRENEIPNIFYKDKGFTRINVFTRVLNENNEYKLVNPGPNISVQTLNKLIDKIKTLNKTDWLCVCGSFAQGINSSIIITLGKLSQKYGFKLIIDTSYSDVLDVLKFHPYLIKPNEEELISWFGADHDTSIETITVLAKKAIIAGAENVLVSLGSRGALLVTPDSVFFGNAPKINVLNTAGAGDTMLGTFIAGRFSGLDDDKNLLNAIVAGSDTARKAWLTNFDGTEELKQQVVVQRLKSEASV